jgi:hypothetical protein
LQNDVMRGRKDMSLVNASLVGIVTTQTKTQKTLKKVER